MSVPIQAQKYSHELIRCDSIDWAIFESCRQIKFSHKRSPLTFGLFWKTVWAKTVVTTQKNICTNYFGPTTGVVSSKFTNSKADRSVGWRGVTLAPSWCVLISQFDWCVTTSEWSASTWSISTPQSIYLGR